MENKWVRALRGGRAEWGGAWAKAYEGGGAMECGALAGGPTGNRCSLECLGVGVTDAPRYQLRREVMTKKRMAWLEPCFSTVAVRPWYVPFSPRAGTETGLR